MRILYHPRIRVRFGLLYNWYAAVGETSGDFTSEENIAPAGWHMPAQSEWDTLINYVGGSAVSGRELKSKGIIYWNANNGLNNYGFDLRGGGQRITTFGSIKDVGTYWTSTLVTQQFRTSRFNSAINSANNMTQGGSGAMNEGKSIRLIKDNDTDTGTMIGNNGRVYKTVTIGTQVWIAENLAETKYRSGNNIPEETDNSAWAALTTGALCAYNNDWSYV